MEPNEIDILTHTVLRDLEQIDEAQETRRARQLWSDVQEADRLDGIHFDLTFVHSVPGAHFDARSCRKLLRIQLLWRARRPSPAPPARQILTVSDDKIDTELPAKLRMELPGILRWVVEGAVLA